jgi:hypothetical protein
MILDFANIAKVALTILGIPVARETMSGKEYEAGPDFARSARVHGGRTWDSLYSEPSTPVRSCRPDVAAPIEPRSHKHG